MHTFYCHFACSEMASVTQVLAFIGHFKTLLVNLCHFVLIKFLIAGYRSCTINETNFEYDIFSQNFGLNLTSKKRNVYQYS